MTRVQAKGFAQLSRRPHMAQLRCGFHLSSSPPYPAVPLHPLARPASPKTDAMASKALSFFSRTRPTATFTTPRTAFKPISSRNFSFTASRMGITKTLISPGNGVDKPKDGDTITMEYTGNLHDPNAPDGKGKQFDTSVGRGDFTIAIGVGKLIRGTLLMPFGQLAADTRRECELKLTSFQAGTRVSSRPTAA